MSRRGQGRRLKVDKYVQVVTAFLMHKGQVFLIRRSERVGSYRGYWAGISGYIEQFPIVQARTEIAEEAGLGPDDIRLRGIGVPVGVDDPEHGRKWMVFPFLFETDHPEKIRTDWESVENRWVTPSDVKNYKTVPGLMDVLERVWPPFGIDHFWREMESIATDTVRGATDLALSGLRSVAALSAQAPEDARRAVLTLAASRPAMGVFPNIASRLISDLERNGSVIRVAERLGEDLVRATDESARLAALELKNTRRILTLNHSRAVYEAIMAWQRGVEKPEVIVAESRPGMEGVGLAKTLSAAGINTTLITDAEIGHFIGDCDALIVGCDAITTTGKLVNKVGTKLAVLAARDAGVPAHAVAQTFKIVPMGWPEVVEEQNPDDVCAGASFRVRNVIFDHTPIEYITSIVSEVGLLTSDVIDQYRPPNIC